MIKMMVDGEDMVLRFCVQDLQRLVVVSSQMDCKSGSQSPIYESIGYRNRMTSSIR